MNQAVKDKPFYLKDNFAPVFEEHSVDGLEVVGEIPPELNGRLLRNGPNPQTGLSDHWFLGNGMIHGVAFENGEALWYRNRYVKTPLYADPKSDPITAMMELEKSAANTHVIQHAGKILALEEAHLPWEINAELATVGTHDFGGKLQTAVTAHPKVCAKTGELLFFGYGIFPPFLTYHRASATGELVQTEEITVPKGTMMHDFNITENYVIWMDLPAVWDLDKLDTGLPLIWDESYGARLGVMPRTGGDSDVVWYDINPCYLFHPLNAYEENGKIVIDVCRKDDLDAPAMLYRWVIDQTAGNVSETQIDDREIEFPRLCDSLVGQKHRYGYVAGLAEEAPFAERYIKYDFNDMSSTSLELGEGREGGEAVFVKDPNRSSEEDGGWLLSCVYDKSTNTSEILILDAAAIDAGPVARVLLPVRVPMGFHGSWIPA